MITNNPESQWFETWFDTEYYHILYANRDEKEAELFIGNLLNYLKPNKEQAHLLDLACGKGRHSIFMNNQGYTVTGVDLSENSISRAKLYQNKNLHFAVQDMREPFNGKFTHIFNLFTSFGYFDVIQDNERVMNAIDSMTDSGSILVIDYLNAYKVVKYLVPQEQKKIEGIEFNIARISDKEHVYKYIQVVDKNELHHFVERVQLLNLDDFRNLLERINFEIIDTFGNFRLEPFSVENADRLIIVARKK